jgi:hypothetical protein
MFNDSQPDFTQGVSGTMPGQEIYHEDLEPIRPFCLVCRLRAATDRLTTRQWLSTIRQNQYETLGPLFCPLHAWHAWEVAHPTSHSPTEVDGIWHHCLTPVLAQALGMLVTQMTEIDHHSGLNNWREVLLALFGKKSSTVLWDRPLCPLCTEGQHEQDEEHALLLAFKARYASLSLSARQQVVAHLCPQDRWLCLPFIRDVASLFFKPERSMIKPMPLWWMIDTEIKGPDHSFVNRLLENSPPIPDEYCPACFVRMEQEHLLITEISQNSRKVKDIPGMDVLVEELCSRHTALLTMEKGGELPTYEKTTKRDSDMLPLASSCWPDGSLRPTTRQRGCIICSVLWGWNLLRVEGMRRAAGSTLIQSGSSEQIAAALEAHHFLLCLPHWQAITATAPGEVVQTLLPVQLKGLTRLLETVLASRDTLHKNVSDASAPIGASAQLDPCLAVLAALAGYPC